MSVSELLLILLVALVVFGPNKLPMLAKHLGQLMAQYHRYQQRIRDIWPVLLKEHLLQENKNRAEKAERSYSLDNPPDKP